MASETIRKIAGSIAYCYRNRGPLKTISIALFLCLAVPVVVVLRINLKVSEWLDDKITGGW